MLCSRVTRLTLAFCLFFCGSYDSDQARAAAWTQAYGKTQVIKTYSFYSTSFTETSDDNSFTKEQQFFKLEYKPLVEVGASNNLTVGIAPSLQNVTTFDGSTAYNNFGLADVDIFFRYKLWQQDTRVFSVQPLVKLPGIYDETISPSLGQQQVDAELRFLYGQSYEYDDKWHFFNLEAAYRKRFEGPGDEFRAEATLGYRLINKVMVMPQISAIYAVDESDTSSRFATNSNDFDLVKAQLSFVREISPNLSIQAGFFSHISARNTGGGGGTILSFWSSF